MRQGRGFVFEFSTERKKTRYNERDAVLRTKEGKAIHLLKTWTLED